MVRRFRLVAPYSTTLAGILGSKQNAVTYPVTQYTVPPAQRVFFYSGPVLSGGS